ncbi:MAG: glycosyltransferase [Bryobacterales bacterium]|nr:glycosyltransferase [Bryobacterales bacterium]
MFLFWFFVVSATLLAAASFRGERKRAEYVCSRLAAEPLESTPRVTLIVPVKGHDDGLKENLASLAALDYPNYSLTVVARSAADIPPGVIPSGSRVVLAGGTDGNTGEKIQNLLAAVRSTRKRMDILAFADSDGRAGPGWLRALVAPLEDPAVGASTGYRWYAPDPPSFWTLVRSVWNAAIAGGFGPGDNRFAWGGAMAIRKTTFDDARVPDFWKGSVSDDYGLTDAVKSAGLTVAFAPGAMVASTDRTTAAEFFPWARRQLTISRIYNPRLWWTALAAHVIYCGAMAAAVIAIANGHAAAEWALVIQLGLGMLKGANRATLAKAELPAFQTWFERYSWVHSIWVPLVTWIWLVTLVSSAFGNTIEWRGNRYLLAREKATKL